MGHGSSSSDRKIGSASATRRVFRSLAIAAALLLIAPASSSADGIDLVWLITESADRNGAFIPFFQR